MLASITTRAKRGLSLIELLVVIAILGIIVSVAAPSFADMLNSRRVQAVASEIASDLAFARAETGLRPQLVAVYFKRSASTSCYTIAYYGSGGSCDCTATGNQQICTGLVTEFKTRQIPTSTGVRFESAPGSALAPGRVSFQSPQMTATPADFYVNVMGTRAQLRVQINAMGRISTCSPGGTMNGVEPC